jgi:NADH:ubiquinone oxidoreductase subunit K
MHGPNIAGYLIVAAFLFATGALGVLIRRSPLIVLLSLEIMLNGANLALIAFSRHFGSIAGHKADGQIFALAVMAVAASEVVVGLGLIVAMARRRLILDVDKFSTLRG